MSFLCRCDTLNERGQGVGKTKEGLLVFASNWLPKELARLRLLEKRGTYIIARVEHLEEPSLDRETPFCPHFSKCGGCQLQHIKKEAQLEFKSSLFDYYSSEQEVKLADLKWVFGKDRGYRTKLILPIQWSDKDKKPVLGFYQTYSNKMEPITSCLIHTKALDRVVQRASSWIETWLKQWPVSSSSPAPWKSLYFLYARESDFDLRVHLALGFREEPSWCDWAISFEKIVSQDLLVHGISQIVESKKSNVWLEGKRKLVSGSEWMQDEQNGYLFDIDPFAFQQVNPEIASLIRKRIVSWIKTHQLGGFLELYCGAGNLSNVIALETGIAVIGVDNLEENINSAQKNAVKLGSAAEFVCSDALEWVRNYSGKKISVWMVNPPRKGLSKELVDLIKVRGPEHLVYMACGQKALLRDIKLLKDFYEIEDIEAYDMFTQTVHFETLSFWKRKQT